MKRYLISLPIIIFLILSGSTNLAFTKHISNLDSLTVQRLGDLCKLWGTIKYFHPEIAYGDIDWDKALIETIPKVKSAQNRDEFRLAVQFLLDKLNDPVTKIEQSDKIIQQKYEIDLLRPQPYYRWLKDSVALVVATDFSQFENMQQSIGNFSKIISKLSKAKGVVYDFRRLKNIDANPETDMSVYFFSNVINQIIPSIIGFDLKLPSHRSRYHYGHEWQQGRRHIYYSGIFTQNNEVIVPKSKNIQFKPTCFIINKYTRGVLDKLVAMQKAGKAVIVAEGSVSGENLYQTYNLQLSDSLEVTIRTSEIIHLDGTTGFQPDLTVPISKDTSVYTNPTIKAATELLSHYQSKRNNDYRDVPTVFATFKENDYSEMTFPILEYRLLALFRYWNAINYFFPYKNLIGYNWQKTLHEFIPKLLAVKDSLEYHLTISELTTRIHDSHAYINSKVHGDYWGNHSPPIKTELIEGKTVITKIMSDSLAKAKQLNIGDVLISIDGEAIEYIRSKLSRYFASSNTQSLERKINTYLLRGMKNTTVNLSVLQKDQIRKILLRRDKPWWEVYSSKREGPIWKEIVEGCGYVDLDRLMPSQVDSAFEALRDTKMMIFDMRGYPRGTAWSIAPRLTDIPVKAAKLYLPVVMSPDSLSITYEYFYSEFRPGSKWRYKGNVVVLVNANTLSQAEYTCMVVQACANTTIIGSGTAGADGDITNIVLPGGITTGFTGMGVLYPDGRQTQRIGIIPDIQVKPTIKGIREGRDEVLEKAIIFYKNMK
jgi:C-terminal processing protease CtpA/Prc